MRNTYASASWEIILPIRYTRGKRKKRWDLRLQERQHVSQEAPSRRYRTSLSYAHLAYRWTLLCRPTQTSNVNLNVQIQIMEDKSRTHPGETQLTLTFFGARSTARPLVAPWTALPTAAASEVVGMGFEVNTPMNRERFKVRDASLAIKSMNELTTCESDWSAFRREDCRLCGSEGSPEPNFKAFLYQFNQYRTPSENIRWRTYPWHH